MARVSHPQPGEKYKVICIDNQSPHKEVEFTFLNISIKGGFEIEVDGKRKEVGSFCDLCYPWACEIHTI